MACMALKGHYNIALSTFAATKLNGPCLRGKNKTIYSADVMQTSNMAGLYKQVCYRGAALWDSKDREIKFYHYTVYVILYCKS